MNQKLSVKQDEIPNRIYTIRGIQVMLDEDLAELYKTETKLFNKAVKRNADRFPKEFMFQLTEVEYNFLNSSQNLRFQFGTSKKHGGRRYLPLVFTEQGVAMLAGVLKSAIAIKTSIQIINAFVAKMEIRAVEMLGRVGKIV
jgi:hypothetical protein